MCKVIISGSHTYPMDQLKRLPIHQALDEVHKQFNLTEVIEGGAQGIDTIAGEWAVLRGIKRTTICADWVSYRRAAGPIRNSEMLKLKPDAVFTFPGGPGTANMRRQAITAKVPTYSIVGFANELVMTLMNPGQCQLKAEKGVLQ